MYSPNGCPAPDGVTSPSALRGHRHAGLGAKAFQNEAPSPGAAIEAQGEGDRLAEHDYLLRIIDQRNEPIFVTLHVEHREWYIVGRWKVGFDLRKFVHLAAVTIAMSSIHSNDYVT